MSLCFSDADVTGRFHVTGRLEAFSGFSHLNTAIQVKGAGAPSCQSGCLATFVVKVACPFVATNNNNNEDGYMMIYDIYC